MTNAHLQGQTFAWVTFDASLTISAALRSMLVNFFDNRRVRVSFELAQSLDETALLAQRSQASLLTLIDDGSHVVQLAKVLRQVRSRSPATVRLVYLSANFVQFAPLLLEASAQIVLGELPSLQRILPQIVAAARLKSSGFHPLTSGLVERLPWSEIVVDSQKK